MRIKKFDLKGAVEQNYILFYMYLLKLEHRYYTLLHLFHLKNYLTVINEVFMSKLDDAIRKDIQELLERGEISAAVALGPVMKPRNNVSEGFSAKGLPQYFTGDRRGKTVIVNLNPGMDANK